MSGAHTQLGRVLFQLNGSTKTPNRIDTLNVVGTITAFFGSNTIQLSDLREVWQIEGQEHESQDLLHAVNTHWSPSEKTQLSRFLVLDRTDKGRNCDKATLIVPFPGTCKFKYVYIYICICIYDIYTYIYLL